MDYWAEAMQDDCYLIAADGWVAKTHRVMEEVKSGKKKGEMKDKGWACDLIPKPYIVARYFAKEQAELDALQSELDTVSASLTELAEEHGGEEGALKDVSTKGDAQEAYTQALVAVWNEEDKAASRAYNAFITQADECAAKVRVLTDHHLVSVLKNNKGNLTLKAIKDRLAATSDPKESAILTSYLEADKEKKAATKEASELLAKADEQYQKRLKTDPLPKNLVDLYITASYLKLLDEQSALKSKVTKAEVALDKLAYDKYPKLNVDAIKALVVDDKWLSMLSIAVHDEMDCVSQTLTTRIRQLAERYGTPLPILVDKVMDLSARVDEHLKRMGQAAMQQLLTGKTRLPGFEGEWEVKRLDHLADIRSGGTPSTSQSHLWDGGIPWCTPTDITALEGSKYLNETNRTISEAGLRLSSAETVPRPFRNYDIPCDDW